MINYSDIEETIGKCFEAMEESSRDKMDQDKADQIAALCLVAQMKVSSLIEEVELKAKHAKNNISKVEGEKYFELKSSNTDKKITENMLLNYIAKDDEVIQVKQSCAEYEANLKKWTFILNTLKDSHHYFKNISKNKQWSE